MVVREALEVPEAIPVPQDVPDTQVLLVQVVLAEMDTKVANREPQGHPVHLVHLDTPPVCPIVIQEMVSMAHLGIEGKSTYTLHRRQHNDLDHLDDTGLFFSQQSPQQK